MKKTLLGHYFQYFLITMMILMGAYFYVYDRLQEVMYRQVQADLQETALLLQPVLPPLDTGSREIDEFCKETAGKTSLRLTIIMPDGLVVGDSDNYIGMLGNHADRPEVMEALRGKSGFSRRYSDTMDIRFAYLAVPLKKEGKVIAVMRLAKPVEVIDTVFSALRVRILLLILIIILASGVFGFYVSKKTKSALLKMEHAARRIHSGDYSVKVDIDFPGEAQALTVEMNRMAGE